MLPVPATARVDERGLDGLQRTEGAASTGNERELLLGFVRWQREQVVATANGLTEEQLRWTPDGRLLPIIGVINHLANMEWRWIEGRYLGRAFPPREEEFVARVDRDGRRRDRRLLASGARTDEIVRGRARPSRCRASATKAGGARRTSSSGSTDPIDLRWVLLHLLEETAHHAGHADSTREMLDGRKIRD